MKKLTLYIFLIFSTLLIPQFMVGQLAENVNAFNAKIKNIEHRTDSSYFKSYTKRTGFPKHQKYNSFHVYFTHLNRQISTDDMNEGRFLNFLEVGYIKKRRFLKKNKEVVPRQSFIFPQNEDPINGFYFQTGFSLLTPLNRVSEGKLVGEGELKMLDFFNQKNMQYAFHISGTYGVVYFGVSKDSIWVVDMTPRNSSNSIETYSYAEYLNCGNEKTMADIVQDP